MTKPVTIRLTDLTKRGFEQMIYELNQEINRIRSEMDTQRSELVSARRRIKQLESKP